MLRRIEKVENIPDFLEGVKNREEKLMGFGHRVYKNYDPRARIIKKHVDEVLEVTGDEPAARDRNRAREAGARRRLLHRAQALPERRLLLGPDLRGARHPDRHVHGDLRDPADLGLDRAVDGDERATASRRSPARARSTPASASARLRADRGARRRREDHRPAGPPSDQKPPRRLDACSRAPLRVAPASRRPGLRASAGKADTRPSV